MMKRIVIDCRYLKMSGIGRYLECILDNLKYDEFEYILWGKKEDIKLFKAKDYIYDEMSPFSFKSLLKSPIKEINKCDILFTPNFIIPCGIKIKIVSMLHDIIFRDMKNMNKNFLDSYIKKHLITRCMKRSNYIYTVSNFSKNRILFYYPKIKNKISVLYNDVKNDFKEFNIKYKKENYLIFVGNIKENKGLIYLIKAMEELKNESNIKLLIIGSKENFRNMDKNILKTDNANIEFSGYVDDEKLKELIAKAKFLVQPSIYEGFGIPPLEAMYLGTKPIISDIEVFKEIYTDFDCIFFKNKDCESLKDAILNSDPILKFDKELAMMRFNQQTNAKKIEELFKKI